jgi:hypothetical protein
MKGCCLRMSKATAFFHKIISPPSLNIYEKKTISSANINGHRGNDPVAGAPDSTCFQ